MRALHQRTSERDALLLATRELTRPPFEQRVDADQAGDLARTTFRLGAFDLFEPQRKHDVLEHGHARVERIRLEDDADVAIARLDIVDARAVERDVAVGWVVDAGEHQQRGRLAATRRAEHGDERAVLDGQVDAIDAGCPKPTLPDDLEHDARHDLPPDP